MSSSTGSLTKKEVMEWMNENEHYLETQNTPTPIRLGSNSSIAQSSTFQVTGSLGTTTIEALSTNSKSSAEAPAAAPLKPELSAGNITSPPKSSPGMNANVVQSPEVSGSINTGTPAQNPVVDAVKASPTPSANITAVTSSPSVVSPKLTNTSSGPVAPSPPASATRKSLPNAPKPATVAGPVAPSPPASATRKSLSNAPKPATGAKSQPGSAKPSEIVTKPAGGQKAPPTAKTSQPVKQTNGNEVKSPPKSAPRAGSPTKPASTSALNATKKPVASAAVAKKPPSTAVSATSPTKAAGVPVTARSPIRRHPSAPPTPTTPGGGPGDDGAAKKLPMNKVKVGAAPAPNINEVKSKIGSLEGVTYKPKGGNVKIPEQKLKWKAESKIGSFSNVKHVPKGGNVKVETKKIEVKDVNSKVGSFQNLKHKPGGGEKKIFDDKEYLKRTQSNSSSEHGGSASHTPRPASSATNGTAASGGDSGATGGVDVSASPNLIDV